MFERKLNSINLGNKTKQLLRDFKGKTRMTIQQYYQAVDEYNNEVEKIQNQKNEEKKQTKNATMSIRRQIEKLGNGLKNSYELKIVPFLNKFPSYQEGMKVLLNEIQKNAISKGVKIDLVLGQKIYSLNTNTINRLSDTIKDDFIVNEDVITSDQAFTVSFLNAENDDVLKIEVFKPTNSHNLYQGDFFKYYHNTHYDFSRYGIFNSKPEKYPDNCIIEALKNAGLEDDKVNKAKLLVECRNFPVCKLNELCDLLGIRIKLIRLKSFTNGRQRERSNTMFGSSGNIYDIGLYDDHYFVNEKTQNTSYSIVNYDNVKHFEHSNMIFGIDKKIRRDEKRYIDSFDLVVLLIDNKDTLLKPIDNIDLFDTQYYERIEETLTNLNYDEEKNTNLVELKEQKPIDSKIVFFDFETISKDTHTPYLCCAVNDELKQSFIGNDCGLQLLKFLSSKYNSVLLIAHNASYDYRFIQQYLNSIDEIAAGNSIYSATGYFNKMKVMVKDSYKLITMALKKFPETFGIQNTVKEVISYDFFNDINILENRFQNIELMEEYLNREGKDINQFRDNLKKWKIINGEKFNAIEYSRRYCEIDCEILQSGYNTFRKWMNELTCIDINNTLTIASLAHRYLIQEGCYEGVYEISGVPRAFIQRCVVGGRVMCANNEKTINTTTKSINDFDAVSLYPSAMARMEGFLKGTPKVLQTTDYNTIRNYDGYFIEIVIKSVGIKRSFPLMSYKNDDGVRMFSNEMIGKTIFVDKISLEDMIRFQNIDFDVIRGYYFNDGFNTQINKTIVNIFNERLRLKKNGNPAEMVYKLIMNSSYGKSIMKPREDETHFFNSEEKMNIYKSRHYCWIKSVEQIANSKLWKVKSINPLISHYNIAQVGVSILSMSKRIMNEVMCCAEDNNIPIFYQDTDSMHLYDEDIEKLSNCFNSVYGRQLIGKQLGQFHSDFDLKGCDDIVATKSIFLGKKCYIDELQGVSKKDGSIQTGYHIRMKGVPNSTILYTCEQLKVSPYELYEKLNKGEKITFDLTEGKKKSNFKYQSDGLVSTLCEFKRDIQFI
jgi:hypothetical protein